MECIPFWTPSAQSILTFIIFGLVITTFVTTLLHEVFNKASLLLFYYQLRSSKECTNFETALDRVLTERNLKN